MWFWAFYLFLVYVCSFSKENLDTSDIQILINYTIWRRNYGHVIRSIYFTKLSWALSEGLQSLTTECTKMKSKTQSLPSTCPVGQQGTFYYNIMQQNKAKQCGIRWVAGPMKPGNSEITEGHDTFAAISLRTNPRSFGFTVNSNPGFISY